VGIVRLKELIPILKNPDITYNLLMAQFWRYVAVPPTLPLSS
jgi:hypothetical protein